jgi:hypothetical protein
VAVAAAGFFFFAGAALAAGFLFAGAAFFAGAALAADFFFAGFDFADLRAVAIVICSFGGWEKMTGSPRVRFSPSGAAWERESEVHGSHRAGPDFVAGAQREKPGARQSKRGLDPAAQATRVSPSQAGGASSAQAKGGGTQVAPSAPTAHCHPSRAQSERVSRSTVSKTPRQRTSSDPSQRARVAAHAGPGGRHAP